MPVSAMDCRFVPFFFPCGYAFAMVETDRCELHDVAIFNGTEESDALLRLARSPIGDECQICSVCRSAREYVERRLAEEGGQVFPPDLSAEAAWRKLQAAIESAKASVHKTA
jgi:hypothetical protein